MRAENAQLQMRLQNGGSDDDAAAAAQAARAERADRPVPPPNPELEKRLFLALGFDVQARDYLDGANYPELHELLGAGEVNVNCRDAAGSSQLMHASYRGDE